VSTPIRIFSGSAFRTIQPPSPPELSSGADLRWYPSSQLGADYSWPCGELPARNQLRSSLPIDLLGSSDVMSGEFDLSQSKVNAVGTYGLIIILLGLYKFAYLLLVPDLDFAVQERYSVCPVIL